MAAVADPRQRQLKIKTGVVKRLGKEKTMYEKEVVDQSKKVEKMKEENKDEHDIKKQIEVLEESKTMIPDCKRRLKTAYEDLKNLIDETRTDLAETEEFKQANQMLEETVLED
ncbi:tubulin-specific chaperone A [Exaiptasia diaphana]|uniref:Tubulin-specific chaperone A n=1 Tax=Exaiptasia diaphana TaxID=2652724 RepID=A0A913X1I7_EXADI|nr:tubulin-specific chaperone A [Exaiptasia diaphana]KXJ16104.1 Tubulin-specific chaperone A [Exaiptasia diaphana]